MKEYVDVEVLKQQDFQDFSNTDVMHAIDHCPRADVEPVRHGHWAKVKENIYGWKYACSVCNGLTKKATFGCPRCRAKMDGKENKE